MQDTTGNIVYTDVGPLSNDRPDHLESTFTIALDFDEHRVEYAQVNHTAHSFKHVSSVDRSTNEGTIIHVAIA